MFDQLLCQLRCKAQSDRVSRPGFLRARCSELQMFIDMNIAVLVEQALEEGKDAEAEHITLLGKSSLIGSELYAPEAMKFESVGFVTDCKARLYELEQLNFDEDETDVFKRLMLAAAENLDDEIWKQFDQRPLKLPFMNGVIEGLSQNPNCDWSGRFEARVKTLAVSNGQVQRTKWEEMMFGPSLGIPDTPSHVTVPESLMYDMKNGRDYINKCVDTSWQSMDNNKNAVRAGAGEWIKMDEYAWMDIYDLEHCFDDEIDEKMCQCLLDILPNKGERRSLPKAIVAGRHLPTGDIATAQKKPLMDKLNGAVNILVDIGEGRGPTANELSKMFDFTVRLVKRAENFAVVYSDDLDASGKLVSKRTLYGQEAIHYRFERCKEIDGVQDSQHLKEFRMFAWTLTTPQHEEFLNWERAAVAGAKQRMADSKAKALEDISKNIKEDAKKKRVSSASSSETAIVAAPPLKEKKLTVDSTRTKLTEDRDNLDEDLVVDTGLISFFGSKAL